jgi:PAS domain S-box-containing protein
LAHAEGETFGLKSHVTVPIWSGDTIIGGLNLLCKEGFSYGDDDLRVLNGIGNQIGVALARCRMQEHLEDLVRERTAALTAEIVERKRIEEVLRENEERYRLMFDANPLPLWVFDRETNKFLAVNNAAVEHYGFSREEFLLMTVADICPKGEVARLKEDLAREPAARRAIRKHKKKDGTLIDVEILAHDILFSGRKARIVLANDITGQLKAQAEKKILEAQFLQAQKMESLGALAGGIAHDFNNILGIILGHASLLQRAMERPETIPSSVDAITKTVARGAGLVRQLLTFSRKSEISVELVRPNDVIDELARMITATFPKSITLGLDLKKDLPAIYADPNQLYQALLNLTINSRDAMPQGGALRLTTDQAPGSTVRQRFSDARHDRYVTITVSDTGEGMDEETQRRAFEPFYTTKSIGKGTGLGMSVVYGVVTAHDGKVFLQSARGKGTTFTLYFPVQEKPEIAKVERRSLGEEIPGGSETLLVVEDEAMLRELVSALLSSKGYNVITAEDGVAAIEQYEAHKNEIALVISDIGLPKLDGVELMKRLRQRDQGVKFVIATGYIDTGIREQMSGMHVQEVIQKPYRPDELLRKVRKVIDLKR